MFEVREIAKAIQELKICQEHLTIKSELISEQKTKIQLLEPQLALSINKNLKLTKELNEHKEKVKDQKKQKLYYLIGGILIGGLAYAILVK